MFEADAPKPPPGTAERAPLRKRSAGNTTIKDVAKAAGVSIATVSYVVNDTHSVSDATRRRVMDAISQLEYRPSALARNLRTQRTRTIGLIMPELSNRSFTVAAHGIEETLQQNGYSLLISESNEDPATEEKLIEVYNSLQVDGLIVAASGHRQHRFAEIIRGTPTVFIDRRPTGFAGDMVLINSRRSTYEATSHLLRKGHTRIGLLLGLKRFSTTQDRIRGYKEALAEAGIPFDRDLIRNGGFGAQSGMALCEELVRDEQVTALFTASSPMTLGAFKKIQEMGLSIPKDVAIIGSDDLDWATATNPPLSMVFQPVAEMGRAAAKLLINRIAEPTEQFQTLFLSCELRLREST